MIRLKVFTCTPGQREVDVVRSDTLLQHRLLILCYWNCSQNNRSCCL
ncbi:hypothetical protein FKM82_008259 [Ascaphus truei]